jgi:hypothetical protein
MISPLRSWFQNTTSTGADEGFGGARNNGQGKQLEADVFAGGSVGELQQINCNPKQAG